MYALHYHFVFITKYRKPLLRGEIRTEVIIHAVHHGEGRDKVTDVCRRLDVGEKTFYQ